MTEESRAMLAWSLGTWEEGAGAGFQERALQSEGCLLGPRSTGSLLQAGLLP